MEKLTQCLNCELDLTKEDNFCSGCGQKNHATRLKIRAFLDEVFNSIFNIDARIWLTLKTAFINVGQLAKEFNQGKRKKYVPPVQFYLFASLIYFLILGIFAKVNGERTDVLLKESLEKRDTIQGNFFHLDFNLESNKFLDIPSYSKQQLNDVLIEQGHPPKFYNRFLLKQSAKGILVGGVSEMQQKLASIASGGMFLLIPVLAWLFYLFFSKIHSFYVEHLVFLIYIQAIIFFIAAFKNIFQILAFKDWFNYISGVVIAIYTIRAMQQFYNRGWIKTIGYFLLLLLLYGLVLIVFMSVFIFIVLIFS